MKVSSPCRWQSLSAQVLAQVSSHAPCIQNPWPGSDHSSTFLARAHKGRLRYYAKSLSFDTRRDLSLGGIFTALPPLLPKIRNRAHPLFSRHATCLCTRFHCLFLIYWTWF